MIRRASIAPVIALALAVLAARVLSSDLSSDASFDPSPDMSSDLLPTDPLSADDPSRRVDCRLGVLAAEGYRIGRDSTDSTRRVLTLRLTGVHPATGQPDPSDWRAEFVELRVNGPSGDLSIDRVSVLRADDADAPLHSPEAARARMRATALLAAAADRCAR
jgi:hypothetical protein